MLKFAHRYKSSHIKRRAKLKRAAKDGLAKLIEIRCDGFLYEISKEEFEKLQLGKFQ